MRFAHLSDFHFTNHPESFPDLRHELLQTLQAIVDDLCRIECYLDFIAITGDLSEDGMLESYQGLQSMLSELRVPVLVIPGNHDSRDTFRKIFPPLANQHDMALLDYTVDIADARVIGIDSVDAGKVTGMLTQAQLSWLEASLPAVHEYRHTIVMIHHPPFSTGLSRYDALSNLPRTAEFARILEGRSNVTLLCGHLHRPYQASWAGAACFIAGSPACQLSADPPYGNTPLRLVDEPYAYFLHDLDQKGNRVVSTRYVRLSGN